MIQAETKPTIFLVIGQITVVREPSILSTVLGSCISVCLLDTSTGIAGMNHYMLPRPLKPETDAPGRFGTLSIPALIRKMQTAGARMQTLSARVFGGGHVLNWSDRCSSIPEENIEEARRILREHRIGIVAEDVGGTKGRRIQFHTDTGSVLVRQVGDRTSL